MSAGIALPRSQPMGRRYRGQHRRRKTSLSVWTVIQQCQRYDTGEMFKLMAKQWGQRGETTVTYLPAPEVIA